jgi:pimeloyl-ACP methyl ester carboxylesterase
MRRGKVTGGDMSIEKEPEGKYIKAKVLELHYHECGRGYPVICIPGAGPGAAAWSTFKGNI